MALVKYDCLCSRGYRMLDPDNEGAGITTSGIAFQFGDILRVLSVPGPHTFSLFEKKNFMVKVVELDDTTQKPYVNGKNEGPITFVAKANLVDGETFTIKDNANTVVFELDVTGDGVTGGNVAIDVSALTTDTQVRDAALTAIQGSTSTVVAASNGTNKIDLTPAASDTFIISDTVADAGFIVVNTTTKNYKVNDAFFGAPVRAVLDIFQEAIVGADNHSDSRGNAPLEVPNAQVTEVSVSTI